jgi:tight adherence protein C
MPTLALIIGLVCVGGAIVLAVWAMTAPSSKQQAEVPAPAQPSMVGAGWQGPTQSLAYGTTISLAPPAAMAAGRAGAAPAGPQELPHLMRRLRALALRLSPAGYGAWLRRRLDLAGNPPAWPADRVLAFKGIGFVVGLLLGALLGLSHGILVVFIALAGAAVGFFLPDILVYNTGDKRQAALLKGMPDAFDMMTVCVEAGLGFDAALSRVALNLDGPIATECARVLQEMQFGMSRTEALRTLADRTNVPEIRAFVSAMVQSSELGISVGVVLREQAREMRIRRRQRAEERAQKMQVKIVVPLVLCLLPALFCIVIGPGALNIIHSFSNAHH